MDLIVSPDGTARFRGRTFRCALGRGGTRADKREGDGATPSGIYRLLEIYYRPDRVAAPGMPRQAAFPIVPLSKTDGWCDDADHPDYNRKIALPHPARHEKLWRADALYDIVAVTDHNSTPVVPGAGSGIFVHVTGGPEYPPTEGCVAFSEEDLRTILADWTAASRLRIGTNGG